MNTELGAALVFRQPGSVLLLLITQLWHALLLLRWVGEVRRRVPSKQQASNTRAKSRLSTSDDDHDEDVVVSVGIKKAGLKDAKAMVAMPDRFAKRSDGSVSESSGGDDDASSLHDDSSMAGTEMDLVADARYSRHAPS